MLQRDVFTTKRKFETFHCAKALMCAIWFWSKWIQILQGAASLHLVKELWMTHTHIASVFVVAKAFGSYFVQPFSSSLTPNRSWKFFAPALVVWQSRQEAVALSCQHSHACCCCFPPCCRLSNLHTRGLVEHQQRRDGERTKHKSSLVAHHKLSSNNLLRLPNRFQITSLPF